MATFRSISANDKKTAKTFLNQLIDVLQEDISGSTSRRKYQHFVTGGIGPGITSSLFQTVYDQDFTLQTSNPIFDITIGLEPSNLVLGGEGTSRFLIPTASYSIDASTKNSYTSSSLMIREKGDIYRQFAQVLLGNGDLTFKIPLEATGGETQSVVNTAMFLAFKRLFSRDQIKRETFAMRFYTTASAVTTFSEGGASLDMPGVIDEGRITNLNRTSVSGSTIFTDVGAIESKFSTFGGQYGTIVNSANTKDKVGLLFYDAGIAVFDLQKITSGSQFMSGTIDAVNQTGVLMLGGGGTDKYRTATFNNFLVSGSIDNIVDHIASTRFQSGSLTAITFQNVTNINSTLIYCRAPADEFNYSSNPTFVDNDGRISVIDLGEDSTQDAFTYITTVGLYDNANNLLAVAKLSRPVEKSPERDLTFRIRLDF